MIDIMSVNSFKNSIIRGVLLLIERIFGPWSLSFFVALFSVKPSGPDENSVYIESIFFRCMGGGGLVKGEGNG